MKQRFAIIALMIATSAVSAQELPRYPVEEDCSLRGRTPEPSPSEIDDCIQREQQVYDNLKIKWSGFPSEIRFY
ncbi:MAG: hypothetical protein WBX25_04130, partial [Rhodomicrobium sp.]